MKYTYGKIIAIRKVSWDMLWHIVYVLPNRRETYDRVSQSEAMSVIPH